MALALFKDSEIRKQLGIKSIEDKEGMNKHINLQQLDFELFKPSNCPLINIYVHRADITNNYLVNRGLFRVEVLAESRVKAKKIIQNIRYILREKFDMRLVNEGERPSDIKCVYRYRLEYLPMVIS